jgi:hypothetical protein
MIRHFIVLLWVMGIAAACQPSAQTATAVIAETASINTSDVLGGVLTVAYPKNWAATPSDGSILLGSQPGISPENTVPAGAVAVGVSGIAPVLAATIVTDGTITAATVLDAYQNTLSSDIQAGSTTAITLNGKSAARLSVAANEGDSLIIVIDQAGAFVVVIGVTAKGELAQHEAAILAIAEQATYELAAE